MFHGTFNTSLLKITLRRVTPSQLIKSDNNMALESGTYISDLNPSNPLGSDPLAFADDHLRLIKSTIKATFPNISGPVTLTHTEINELPQDLEDAVDALTVAINNAVAATKNSLYPVGSIYTNAVDNTNPSELLGFGTWVAFGAGRVPVGFNGIDPLFDTAEGTGGSKDAIVVSHTHTATTNSTGGHNHKMFADEVVPHFSNTIQNNPTWAVARQGTSNNDPSYQMAHTATGSAVATMGITSTEGAHSHTVTVNGTGNSGTNANLQPYITVYMWKRTT
jgi:hypothetical protein